MVNLESKEQDKGKIFHDNIWKVVEQFHEESSLSGFSAKFYNGVGMFLTSNADNGIDESISEVMSELNDLRETLPYSAEISITGIQFGVKTKDDLTRSIVSSLLERYVFQGTRIPFGDGKDDYHFTELFASTLDNYDANFEEFLKTYPEFLQKKYEQMRLGKK